MFTTNVGTTVPDPGSRDRDVVLVSVGLLGKPKGGLGIWNRVGMRKGRSVYVQPGTKVDRVASFTPKEGFQVSKRGTKGR